MTRTQIRLPDELYRRAKTFAAERELSLAEVARQGIELLISRFPATRGLVSEWKLPQVDAGGLRVPLEQLREIAASDEASRAWE